MEFVDTEGGELLQKPYTNHHERPTGVGITTTFTLPANDSARLLSASQIDLPKESYRNTLGVKHFTMIQKPDLRLEEGSRKGFYSPERKHPEGAAGSPNQLKLLPKDTIELSAETIKAKVFTEYFSMIDDLVIVADMKLKIISNNYSAKIIENVIRKFNKHKKRINMQNLKPDSGNANLECCFNMLEKDQIRCNEETVMNLIDIYTVLNYKTKKLSEEEMKKFQDAKVDKILRIIEGLESGIKISKREEDEEKSTNFKKISKMKSSMRAINIKKSNLTVRICKLGM